MITYLCRKEEFDMEKKVRDFVNLYNRNIDLNQSIFNEAERDFIFNSEYVKIPREYISFEKITEDNCDLEHAEVYEYEDTGILELQAFSYETYGTMYFWANPNLDEEAYKKDKIEYIKKVINKRKVDVLKRLKELEDLNKVIEILNTKI